MLIIYRYVCSCSSPPVVRKTANRIGETGRPWLSFPRFACPGVGPARNKSIAGSVERILPDTPIPPTGEPAQAGFYPEIWIFRGMMYNLGVWRGLFFFGGQQ